MRPDAMIFVFRMLSFKSAFSLPSVTFIKRLFSSSSLSARRMLDPTKKRSPHPRAKDKPQQTGRRGKIAFIIKPHTCQRCSEFSNKTLFIPGTRDLRETEPDLTFCVWVSPVGPWKTSKMTEWFLFISKANHSILQKSKSMPQTLNCLFNLYAESIMWNARLNEAQAGNQDCWEKYQ